MNLHEFDIIIINSSGGKDSICSIWEICRMADEQEFPKNMIFVSHQDLGESEWPGTIDLVKRQSDHFGLELHVSKYRNKAGENKTLLEYVQRRKKWPSIDKRYCTSDFKRGPGGRIVTKLTKGLGECRVLYVFGFRADESRFRKDKEPFTFNKRRSSQKRKVFDFLPIHHWTTKDVWKVIREHDLPYHPAYDLGMPRLSCCFCVLSPFDALVVAGKANPELLEKYVQVEKEIGHTFKSGETIESVQKAIENNYEPKKIPNWEM